jgi:hypothetical protein
MEEMSGYRQDDLAGHPVGSLIPADLEAGHDSHRAGYAQAPEARPMGAGLARPGWTRGGVVLGGDPVC